MKLQICVQISVVNGIFPPPPPPLKPTKEGVSSFMHMCREKTDGGMVGRC